MIVGIEARTGKTVNLDAGLVLVVLRPADWPWGRRVGVSAAEDRLLLVVCPGFS